MVKKIISYKSGNKYDDELKEGKKNGKGVYFLKMEIFLMGFRKMGKEGSYVKKGREKEHGLWEKDILKEKVEK